MKKVFPSDDHVIPVLPELLSSIRQLIDASRRRVAVAVNAELTMLYWHVGTHIRSAILQGERAEYGKKIIAHLSRDLTVIYGNGWSEKTLRHCLRTGRQLSWTHIKSLIYLEDPLKRDFYIELCRLEHWSVRQLQDRINSQLNGRNGCRLTIAIITLIYYSIIASSGG